VARAEEAFKPGALEEGVIDLCADLVSREFGDARRAVDLLRVSGEVTAESKSSVVTKDHVGRAWDRVNRDWVREMILDFPRGHRLFSACIAYAHLDEEYATTGEAYSLYKGLMEETGRAPLGERRFTEIINELSLMGLLNAPKVSRGRYGYTKMITLRLNPETVLDILFPKWRELKSATHD